MHCLKMQVLLLFRDGEATDQGRTVIEKGVCYLFLRCRVSLCKISWRGPKVSLEAEAARGEYKKDPLLWFPWTLKASRFMIGSVTVAFGYRDLALSDEGRGIVNPV